MAIATHLAAPYRVLLQKLWGAVAVMSIERAYYIS